MSTLFKRSIMLCFALAIVTSLTTPILGVFVSGAFAGEDAGSNVETAPAGLSTDNILWTGRSHNRSVTAADLDFPDGSRIPGQTTTAARFQPESGITVDLPTTTAFRNAGLAEMSERIIGVVQIADTAQTMADVLTIGAEISLASMPGIPLFNDLFLSVHYFKDADRLRPLQEITPLAASIFVEDADLLKTLDYSRLRLTLWRYPLTLDPETGQYTTPDDAKYVPAKADNVRLEDGIFSATVFQDGLFVPLLTTLWVDEAFPAILAAKSLREQPVVLTGFFPTWGVSPESGVTPEEAATRYTVTIDGVDMVFRAPATAIDGFNADYAISPILDDQTPNYAYLWTHPNLITNENASIQVVYDDVLTASAIVAIKNTEMVYTAITTNVAVSPPPPATITLAPGQSAVPTSTGEYPLEAGRFFADETVAASIETADGWGLVRWLHDGIAAPTAQVYEFTTHDTPTNLTAEIASYTLTTTVQPVPDIGDILVAPAPAPDTPGYGHGTEVTLTAQAANPETHVLNSWRINGQEFTGVAENFSNTHTFTILGDSTAQANFKRKLRIDDVSLTAIPVNLSVPVALTGVFPTWMGADASTLNKTAPALTADEAEMRYEILIGGAAASFIAPQNTSFTALGEGITPLDDADVNAQNIAYVWSPELLEPPEKFDYIPLIIKDRLNPLNTFSLTLPGAMFVRVVSLNVEVLPENTTAVVITTPERGVIPTTDGSFLPLDPRDYIAGDKVNLSAVPAYLLFKYRIIEESATREITAANYELTITEDTLLKAIFEHDAHELKIVPSADGSIAATPPSSPGWPVGWYEVDSEIVLTATPNPGYRFVSWTHDLAGQGDNPITITIDSDKQVGASYLPPESVALNLWPAQGGSVILQPEGLVDSTNPNVHIYALGTVVRLIGKSDAGFRFDQWRIVDDFGDRFRTENPWDLQLAQDFVIEPQFMPTFNLNVSAIPEIGGTVVVAPPQPAAGYDAGTVVTLTANPASESGYRFVQWTGANATDARPNSTTAAVSLVMDGNKQLAARFSQIVVASIQPAEAWIFGGIVAKVSGEALTGGARVRFGNQEAPLFDVAPSGQYAFVEVPPLANPGDAESVKVALAFVDGDVVVPYPPGFLYKQRAISGRLYTAAFAATQAGAATSVFAGRIGGRDAFVTLPPLGETPVYGIIRVALPGMLAASGSDIVAVMPGASQGGLYDVGIHLYMPKTGVTALPQYGLMSYQDVTCELLAFNRPYHVTDATPEPASAPVRINMAAQPDTEPTYAAIRSGISLWGVSSRYDYLYDAELPDSAAPIFQSMLQNDEVIPANDPLLDATDAIRALSGARAYGGEEDICANCFTWRRGATLPVTAHRAIKLTAINNMPVNGTGSGPIEGGTTVTLTSPYGGLAWIHSIELAGLSPTVGGKIDARDLVSVQGEDEFLLEFKTPKSARPGMTSIIIRPAANPEQAIVLQNVFEYTRPPIRWWLILLILIGLMLGVIGMATGL